MHCQQMQSSFNSTQCFNLFFFCTKHDWHILVDPEPECHRFVMIVEKIEAYFCTLTSERTSRAMRSTVRGQSGVPRQKKHHLANPLSLRDISQWNILPTEFQTFICFHNKRVHICEPLYVCGPFYTDKTWYCWPDIIPTRFRLLLRTIQPLNQAH